MLEKIEKRKCCGCTACYNVCPRQCIKMSDDNEGFKYPIVDRDKCVNCGLCEKVCPFINVIRTKTLKRCYAIRSIKSDIDQLYTSGGFFYSAAKKIIEMGGVVYGVGYDGLIVKHLRIKETCKIKDVLGSKYVQSELGDTFRKVKEDLRCGMYVLFSGTLCQIAGLKNYLVEEYDRLITCDVVCHGTPSPILWEKYVNFMEKKYHSKIKNVNFRNRTYGYHSSTMKICFENGKEYYGSARVDYYLKSFFSEISSRLSCYSCAYKTINRCSDISLFDCWHFSKLTGIKDDDKGYTNVLINSNKGHRFFSTIQDSYKTFEVDYNEAICLDGIMVKESAKPHKDRELYYKSLQYGIEYAVKKHISISQKDNLLERIKPIVLNNKLSKCIISWRKSL